MPNLNCANCAEHVEIRDTLIELRTLQKMNCGKVDDILVVLRGESGTDGLVGRVKTLELRSEENGEKIDELLRAQKEFEKRIQVAEKRRERTVGVILGLGLSAGMAGVGIWEIVKVVLGV